jgi:ribulose-5-phosphate 4-epimerase/fuculose-1-phosphate aldolase
MRLPADAGMIFASGLEDWPRISVADLHAISTARSSGLAELHALIYRTRGDAGAVAIASPPGARLLARHGGQLPPLFDEQVRHIGAPTAPLRSDGDVSTEMIAKALMRGANAVLLDDRLLCLGMTCERVLHNTELYEKCARAYVIAKASGSRIELIPAWVRIIANRRLLQDERHVAASYRAGDVYRDINAY